MDESALRKLLDRVRRRSRRRRRGGAPAAPAAVRRAGLRHGRPPPGAPAGVARGRLRSGKERRAVCGHHRRAPRRRRCGSGSGGRQVVLSRATAEQVAAVLAAYPGGSVCGSTVVWRPAPGRSETVVVVTAGTADLVGGRRVSVNLAGLRFRAALVADAGVAGLHRLLAHLELLQAADAIVVVAGMEGALASVVGGLCAAPIVAVPTSAGGYGAGLGGVTALLAMLSSCASGLVVVGIDNGFGAACAVARILAPAAGTLRGLPGGPAGRDHGRLVALLRRHRRRYGPRQPGRRRRRPGAGGARTGGPARLVGGPWRPRPCCGPVWPAPTCGCGRATPRWSAPTPTSWV